MPTTYPGEPEKAIPATPPMTVDDCPVCGEAVEGIETWKNTYPVMEREVMPSGRVVEWQKSPYLERKPGPHRAKLSPCGHEIGDIECTETKGHKVVTFSAMTDEQRARAFADDYAVEQGYAR